ncbi:methyltransferase domain-containing protein [Frondihabitans cladoniiphilus]|uniref:Trans-aconitate 2-methyltransferase n=1 Tax=Frondihabitans cladoniiphilus TaxID=715785 RepID=A0ABP8W910_9MICO
MTGTRWNPSRYGQYAGERAQPFLDLTARIPTLSPRRVVDLGCGPGNMTRLLADRWPDAEVVGIDSSPDMLEAAREQDDLPANLRFEHESIENWRPSPGDDVVVTNAALQWVPGHQRMLPAWFAALDPGATFALQVPGNFASPSHTLLKAATEAPRWRDRLGQVFVRDADAVETGAGYLALALEAGLRAEAWDTTYLHVLPGENAVLDWSRGTRLRPVLSLLDDAEAAEFEAAYAAALRDAYPKGPHGTVYPFLRHFLVATKPERP